MWSQDWKLDLWLHMKNNHILLALFMAHPDHPFSPRERQVGLAISLIVGYGLALLFDSVCQTKTASLVVNLCVAAIVQTFVDTIYAAVATCACLQEGVPSCVKKCCECLGKCVVTLLCFFALVLFILGAILMANPSNAEDDEECLQWTNTTVTHRVLASQAHCEFNGTWGGSSWKFAASKAQAFLFTTVLTEMVKWAMARRAQMKPDDAEQIKKWRSTSKGCCCGCCCAKKKPDSTIWDTWVGADSKFEDLPPFPPQYAVLSVPDPRFVLFV